MLYGAECALLHVAEIGGGGGGEGGGFCAEAGSAEMDRYEAGGKGHIGFGFGEIAFRTDHHDDFRTVKSLESLLDAYAWNIFIFKAVGYQSKGVAILSVSLAILNSFPAILSFSPVILSFSTVILSVSEGSPRLSGNELLHRNRLIDNRHDSLERLLRGADQNLLDTGGLQNPSFRMFSDHRGELVKTDLAGLFCEPFIPVVVLGRADREVEPVGMSAPVVL